jgi:hypothetical protein
MRTPLSHAAVFPLLLLVAATAAPPDVRPEWNATIHQVVVVKASSLMPPPMQRQILRHREEILRGCLDVLRNGFEQRPTAAELRESCERIILAIGRRTPFDSICYELGRLSALTAEYSPVTESRGVAAGSAPIAGFRDFLSSEYRSFPLVISREGEAYLMRGSLIGYLDYVAARNADRARALARALSDEKAETWRDQRSLAYGLATLIYNDLVLDTARLWLYVWQQAGGEIGDAPYFLIKPAEGR